MADLTHGNWMPHNCNDERMIDWVIANLKIKDFDILLCKGFDCTCGYTLETIGFWNIMNDADNWEPWMTEINEQEIRVYYCYVCKQWAIDDNQ